MQLAPRNSHNIRTRWLPLALLIAVLLSVYWRLLLFPNQYVWFDHWDMCQLEIPRVTFIANNLQNGRLPLWDPYIWGGVPVLGSSQPGPLFPLTLLLEILPLDHGKISFMALNGVFFLQRILMGYLALLFFRELGIKAWAAAIGGALFAAGGYVGSLPWLDISNAVVCVPAVALFSLRLARNHRSGRDAALLGLSLGLCWISGHHEIPMLTTYALLGYVGWRVLKQWLEHRSVDRRMVSLFALSLALASAISSVQTIPLLEFGRHAKRWVGLPEPIGWNQIVPYEIHQRHSIHWSDLLTVLYPGATPETHTTLFLGAAFTTLALWGLLTTWRSKVTQGLAWSAGLSLLYALGANTPLHRILYALLPAFDKARTPPRGLFIFALAAAGLVAIGLEKLVSDQPRRKQFWALASGVMLSAAAISYFVNTPKMYRLESSNYVTLAWISTLILCASCLPNLPVWIRGLLPIAAIALELTTVSSLRVSSVSDDKTVCAPDLLQHDSLVDSLRARANGGRIALQGDAIRTSLGDLYQIDQFGSFVAGVPMDLFTLDIYSPRTQQLLGVTVNITGKWPASEIGIFEQPAFPPAWVSHAAIRVSSSAELQARMADESIPLPGTAIVLGGNAPQLSGSLTSEPVAVERPDSDHVVLSVNLESRGLVTVSGVDYPGWKATLDGQPAPIVRTYGALRGVVAGKGAHVIEMRYRPDSVLLGGILSALGLIAACVTGCAFSRRSSN